MAILNIVKYGDERLRTRSKEVTKISKKIRTLVEDMVDTMYANNGVGLAAPQVGENLRIFVIDVSMENEPLCPRVFINPKIIKKSGAMNSNEGCLSFPNAYCDVRRYSAVTVKGVDLNNRPFVLEAPADSLMSKAIQHELDHLDGILFVDHSRNIFDAVEMLKSNDLAELDMSKIIENKELEEQIANQQNKE